MIVLPKVFLNIDESLVIPHNISRFKVLTYLWSILSHARSESLSLVCLVFPEGKRRRNDTPPPTTSDSKVLREPAVATPSSSDAEQATEKHVM